MAKSPQHTLQTMETRTRFDLNAGIQGWREELAAQPDLTAEERRELEAHLCDAVAELRQRGLNEQESFWLACRRVGHPQRLAEEFAKADPARAWRERVFWLVIGICALRIWTGVPAQLMDSLRERMAYLCGHNFFLPDWVLFYLPFRAQWIVEHVLRGMVFIVLWRWLPLVCVLVLFACGRLDRVVSALRFLFQSRSRFLVTAAASLVIYYAWFIFEASQYAGQGMSGPGTLPLDFLVQMGLGNAIISALLVGVIAWLMPAERPLAARV